MLKAGMKSQHRHANESWDFITAYKLAKHRFSRLTIDDSRFT